jgi:hypothetical protein
MPRHENTGRKEQESTREYKRVQEGIKEGMQGDSCGGEARARSLRRLGHVHDGSGQADDRLGLLPRLAEAGCLRGLPAPSGSADTVS